MSKREALEISEAGIIEPVPVPAQPDGRPLIGVLMVMASVLLFAGNDIVTKVLVTQYPVPLVAAMRYIMQFVLMLALLPAGPVLGEKVAAASVLAAVVGFAGVLLIVRPGGGLDLFGVIFVLIAVTTSVVYYLLSRVLARTESTLTMLFYTALVGAVCFGAMLPWSWSGPAPDLPTIVMFASQGVATGLGHYLFTAAHREATASLLAPVGYMQLLWVGLLSWLIFGHVPDALTIAGMALVTMAGVSIAMISARRR